MLSRSRARLIGAFFVLAAATSFIALALYQDVLNDPATAAATEVRLGAFLEAVLVISVIGTAVAVWPVVSPYGPSTALAYVIGRTVEALAIMIGAMSLLAVLTVPSELLVSLHDVTFLFGPGLAIGINTGLLAWLMYRSMLVPRWIALIGLVAGPLVFVSSTAVLFGAYEQLSPVAAVGALPVFVWEMSLAFWLIVKGFLPPSVEVREPTDTLVRGGVA